ncbi:MAG: hypothetical protein H6623_05165 [Bdellovibrionaceae bacterium]|nr:hypothetical protein [Pseudobdellovibrionaceae bacterium]
MKYFLSFILLVGAVGLILFDHYNAEYWLTPPEKRVDTKWQQEVDKVVRETKRLQTAIYLIKDIELTTTDQQFKDLIDKSKVPFHKANKGKYKLKIQIMPWIEDMEYGYLIQHEFFDETNNKVFEFNADIKIGKLW